MARYCRSRVDLRPSKPGRGAMLTEGYGSRKQWEPVNARLINLLESQLSVRGLNYGQLAVLIGRDSSTVSRALSGRGIPSRAVTELMARSLGLDEHTLMAVRGEAVAIRRRGQSVRAAGGPPDGMRTHMEFLDALQETIRGAKLSQREIGLRSHGTLKRSTIGAVLRGERSAPLELVMTIIEICGVVTPSAVVSWEEAWCDLAEPDRERRRQRRWAGYSLQRYLRGLPAHRRPSTWARYVEERNLDDILRGNLQ
ncbi:helix-turn-helix transcriptional regulator [Streptomyces bauhiniae]